jgi:hypothetical protein
LAHHSGSQYGGGERISEEMMNHGAWAGATFTPILLRCDHLASWTSVWRPVQHGLVWQLPCEFMLWGRDVPDHRRRQERFLSFLKEFVFIFGLIILWSHFL